MSGSRVRTALIRFAASRSRASPEANTKCHGCVFEFDGAPTASSTASTTSSRGTDLSGWNSRIARAESGVPRTGSL
jgi:hypothetical protein